MNKTESNEKLEFGKKILTASIGQCVHVAGSYNFIQIAQNLGYNCKFLGPAVETSKIIEEIQNFKPEIVGLSYRLTSATLKPLLVSFFDQYKKLAKKPKKLYFAGTPEVVNIARKFGKFDHFFIGGESNFDVISVLRDSREDYEETQNIPLSLKERIEWKKPYPIIRAHFGLPDFDETVNGIREIAKSKVLDVISIAPDQNTQANFFHPEEQLEHLSGAGGVPLRSRDDLLELHEARLTGNYPMLRIYAGTRDFIKLGKLFDQTIKNAWAAIPIFWFNQMDGRGPLSLKLSIKKHLETIQWYGLHDIPVEINDPHHWGLRDAPDAIVTADAFLCGNIAKELGVRNYIAQYMFNTPPTTSLDMDLAKIMAIDELLKTLIDDDFNVIRQVRTGLASFPLDLAKAKGQLAAASVIQLMLKPDIVHVVSYSEATHAAKPEDIIESCKIVDQVINKIYSSELNIKTRRIIERKDELIKQTSWIINCIEKLSNLEKESKITFANHEMLNDLVKYGIFDAPHLKGNKFALGKIKTKIINGACYSWDELRHQRYDEIRRVQDILFEIPKYSSLPSLYDEPSTRVIE